MKNVLVVALTGLALLFWCASVAGAAIPPHFSLEMPGIHAYTDWPSVAAGEVVKFRVSASVSYRLQIARLGTKVDDPTSDTVLAEFSGISKVQAIHPGSYVHVAQGLANEPMAAFTLETWVRLWNTHDWSGLITQYDAAGGRAGYGLFLNPDGKIGFYVGDGGEYNHLNQHYTAPVVVSSQWYHIVATWDGQEKAIWADGRLVSRWLWNGLVNPGSAYLRLGAYGINGLATNFLDGDMAMPVIYNRALSPQEIAARYADQGQTAPRGSQVLAAWTFTEERGEIVADASGNNHDGRIINHGQGMIGGSSFDRYNVPRY